MTPAFGEDKVHRHFKATVEDKDSNYNDRKLLESFKDLIVNVIEFSSNQKHDEEQLSGCLLNSYNFNFSGVSGLWYLLLCSFLTYILAYSPSPDMFGFFNSSFQKALPIYFSSALLSPLFTPLSSRFPFLNYPFLWKEYLTTELLWEPPLYVWLNLKCSSISLPKLRALPAGGNLGKRRSNRESEQRCARHRCIILPRCWPIRSATITMTLCTAWCQCTFSPPSVQNMQPTQVLCWISAA